MSGFSGHGNAIVDDRDARILDAGRAKSLGYMTRDGNEQSGLAILPSRDAGIAHRKGHAPRNHEGRAGGKRAERMTAGVVGVDQIEAAREQTETQSAERLAGQALLSGGGEKRRSRPRKEHGFMAGGEKSAVQPKHLPLSSAHFAAAIEMKDRAFIHRASLSPAFAYFRKV